jgi:hypothetical protein
MELVSRNMTIACDDGTFKLSDFTDCKEIEQAAAKIFQTDSVKIIDLLLNSVLTSHITLTRERYRSTKQRITFVFKILQEYFLACYLTRNQEDVSLYPKHINQLHEEIIKTEDEEDLSFYLRKSFAILDQATSSSEIGGFHVPVASSTTSNTVYIQAQEVNLMSEQPASISISGGTFSGTTYFAPHHGDTIGTINQYFGSNEQEEIAELKQFISELEAKYPTVQDEPAAEKILNDELSSVHSSNPTRWQTLRNQMIILKRQILNPERHLQATKATVVEVAKSAFEKSLIAKAVITYLDKLSEEPNHGV